MRKFLFVILTVLPFFLLAQEAKIRSGPMLGQVQMREAEIWLQTNYGAEVELQYCQTDSDNWQSKKYITQEEDHFIAHLFPGPLEPGTSYEYRILIDGKEQAFNFPLAFKTQNLWQWRKDPPDFRVLVGSCTYINQTVYDRPGKPYGGGYEIFANMQKAEADLMLWLGDNIYLREADWYSRTGIYERYAHYRSLPELQEFFASQANIAIWDDHDYGPNDSDRSYSMKETTLDAFKDFWANPAYGLGDCGGITGHYQFNDVEFFLLDNRWNRSPQGLGEDEEQVLGECQIDWLIEAMRFSRATYKIVCIGGQVLNTAKVYENMSNYEKERQYLLDQIAKYNIRNVVFLTGDRHHSELSEIRIGDLMIYDLTVSPLTSSAGRNSQNEGNKLRVEGTYFGERNYASLDFSGSLSERKLLITLYDTSGKRIWRREI